MASEDTGAPVPGTGLVLVVDDEYRPCFPHTWYVATGEEAFAILDDTSVAELWLRHDLETIVASLVTLLLDEEPWEHSKIGTLVIPLEDLSAPETELERKFKGHCKIRRVQLTPELYDKV